jgi:hypothetical protein
MANHIVPTPFPEDKYTGSVTFRRDANSKGEIPSSVLRTLYTRGCVELDNLPVWDLQNAIHPCFDRARFRDLTEAEYKFLTPAVTLASRLIKEREYLDFWTTMTVGKPKERSTREDGVDVKDEYIVPNATWTQHLPAAKRALTRRKLKEIAGIITFFNIDEKWSQADNDRVGATFMDPNIRDCTR